jgi:hypothetical protein
MTRTASRPRRTRLARITAAGLVAAAGVTALLLKASPGVYERTAPMGADPEAVRGFNQRVVNHVGNVLLDESGGTPLDLEVTEAMVNARVARFLADERRTGAAVPPVLAHLRVGFERGAVVLATRLGDGWSAVVVSQWLRLEPDGRGRLRVVPVGTNVGHVPLPAGLLGSLRASAEAAFGSPDGPAPDGGDEDGKGPPRVVEAIFDALSGEPVPLGKGKRRIVLEAVEVERGVLRMRGRRAGREDAGDG